MNAQEILTANKKEFFVIDLMKANTGADEIGKYLWCYEVEIPEEEIEVLLIWHLYYIFENISEKSLDKNMAIELLDLIAKSINEGKNKRL